MKIRSLFCIAMLFAIVPCGVAQTIDTLWTAFIPGEGNTTFLGGTPLADGGFVAVGYTRVSFSHDDYFAAKVDEEGELVWEKTFAGTELDDKLECVVELSNGNLVTAGSKELESALVVLIMSPDGDSLSMIEYAPKGLCSARDMLYVSDSEVAISGFRLGDDGSHSDVWLMSILADGDSLWSRTYGGDGTDTGGGIAMHDDNTRQLVGTWNSAGTSGESDLWTQRIGSDGDPLGGPQLFGTELPDRGTDVLVTPTGDIFLCGASTTGAGHRALLVRIPPAGEPWLQEYFNAGSEQQFLGMVPRMGGVLCAGWSGSFASQTRPLLMIINSFGEVELSYNFGASEPGSGFYGVKQMSAGGSVAYGAYYLAPQRYGFLMRIAPAGGASGVVTEIASGDPVAGARVGVVGGNDFTVTDPSGVYTLELPSGTYEIAAYGYCVDSSEVQTVEVLERELTALNLTVGVPELDAPQTSVNMYGQNHTTAVGRYRIHNSGSGVLYYSASARELDPPGDWLSLANESGAIPPGGATDIQLIVEADTSDAGIWDYYGEFELHTNTCPDTFRVLPVLVAVLDADDNAQSIPADFRLDSAYPNPFNATTRLRFALPHAADVSLELFNLNGQFMRTIASGAFEQGTHEITLALPNEPSGVYLVRLNAANHSATRKIVLLK